MATFTCLPTGASSRGHQLKAVHTDGTHPAGALNDLPVKNIDTDKIRNKLGIRPMKDFLHRAELDQIPVLHDSDLVGQGPGIVQVVDNVYDRGPPLLNCLFKKAPGLVPGLEIQGGKGFVHEQKPWFHGKGPCKCDPLLFTP